MTDPDVHFIETSTPNYFVCVDFGHGGDVATKTVFEKTPGGIRIISMETIGKTVDFNKEEREKVLQELQNFKLDNHEERKANNIE